LVFDIFEVPKMENAGLEQRINHDGSIHELGCINNEVIKYKRIRINSNVKDLDRYMIQNQILKLSRKYESILKDGIFEVFIKLSFFKALFKLEAQLTKKELTMKCGPKRYPYNFSHNITSKVLNHKIIMKKTQNEGVTIEN